MMCGKHRTMMGVLLLVLGLLFLFVDLGIWTFWGIKWWSALLILFGVMKLSSSMCGDCKAMHGMPAKRRR